MRTRTIMVVAKGGASWYHGLRAAAAAAELVNDFGYGSHNTTSIVPSNMPDAFAAVHIKGASKANLPAAPGTFGREVETW